MIGMFYGEYLPYASLLPCQACLSDPGLPVHNLYYDLPRNARLKDLGLPVSSLDYELPALSSQNRYRVSTVSETSESVWGSTVVLIAHHGFDLGLPVSSLDHELPALSS